MYYVFSVIYKPLILDDGGAMFGQRLRLARKKAGLSMQALATQISPKVSAQAISKYESGKMMPSSAVLVGLGKTLGVSLDFLLGGQVTALRKIEFRKHLSSSARDRARAEAIVTEKLEDYLAIEEILDVAQCESSFGNSVIEQIDSFDAIDAISLDLRDRWNLGIDPIASMSGLLEDKGILVIEADLPEHTDGLACEVKYSDSRPITKVIVVSCHTGVERKRLNFAHELAYRVIRATGNPEIPLKKAMNYFAGAFLVPKEHLINEVGEHRHRMTYHEMMRLKRTYGVPAALLLMRLGQTGILTRSAIEYAFRGYAHKWRTEEPEPIVSNEGFGAFEQPQKFERLVWRALGEQLISPARAAQFLRLPLATVEREIKGC